MDLGIAGKRAAVAASSEGLGLGSARALVEAGARVVVNGRRADKVAEAVAELGPLAVPVVGDVGSTEGAVAFVEAAAEALGGPVEILVTNAGGPPLGTFASVPLEAYLPALELSLLSVVGMCTAAVPAMQAAGWGRIVAITSLFVRQPNANFMLSNTARAGATGFLKTLAREVAKDGITVNSLQPGLHATNRVRSAYGDADPGALALGVPAGFVGTAEDFGQVVAFLCSQQARYVTGVHVPVDGGSYAGLL